MGLVLIWLVYLVKQFFVIHYFHYKPFVLFGVAYSRCRAFDKHLANILRPQFQSPLTVVVLLIVCSFTFQCSFQCIKGILCQIKMHIKHTNDNTNIVMEITAK
jgi:hypothetical protein